MSWPDQRSTRSSYLWIQLVTICPLPHTEVKPVVLSNVYVTFRFTVLLWCSRECRWGQEFSVSCCCEFHSHQSKSHSVAVWEFLCMGGWARKCDLQAAVSLARTQIRGWGVELRGSFQIQTFQIIHWLKSLAKILNKHGKAKTCNTLK